MPEVPLRNVTTWKDPHPKRAEAHANCHLKRLGLKLVVLTWITIVPLQCAWLLTLLVDLLMCVRFLSLKILLANGSFGRRKAHYWPFAELAVSNGMYQAPTEPKVTWKRHWWSLDEVREQTQRPQYFSLGPMNTTSTFRLRHENILPVVEDVNSQGKGPEEGKGKTDVQEWIAIALCQASPWLLHISELEFPGLMEWC